MFQSIPTMLGCLGAVIIALIASAAGLGATLMAFPNFFRLLRICGAFYLLWLGIQAWRNARLKHTQEQPIAGKEPFQAHSPFTQWKNGFLVGISNPKLLVFATAFFPQFIVPTEPHLLQFIILIASFSICEMFWYSIYAVGGRSLTHQLERPSVRRIFDQITGGIFIMFGAFLLWERQ
ncbi:LysE family translocator [Zymomonas sp.]|uniref:LysE family translocator n=1 Tax=Zymomonas sp. TaxID=2068624 RepID=UPI0025CDC52A|nr:LysE family translocator [Zymomonas sp.]